MPFDCTPDIIAPASSPVRYGSSEKYSKFLPHRGERLILAPGPNITATSSCRHASPNATPTSRTSSRSHDAASVTAVGKQVAGTLTFKPRLSPSILCLRRPCGPSATMMALRPSRSTGLKCQKSRPEHSDAFSSSVISFKIPSILSLMLPPKTNNHTSRFINPKYLTSSCNI